MMEMSVREIRNLALANDIRDRSFKEQAFRLFSVIGLYFEYQGVQDTDAIKCYGDDIYEKQFDGSPFVYLVGYNPEGFVMDIIYPQVGGDGIIFSTNYTNMMSFCDDMESFKSLGVSALENHFDLVTGAVTWEHDFVDLAEQDYVEIPESVSTSEPISELISGSIVEPTSEQANEPERILFMYEDMESILKGNDFMDVAETDEDEEEAMVTDRFLEDLSIQQPPVIDRPIHEIRILSLKYENSTVAFRFKTDIGAFDMRKSVAFHYGLSDLKVTKMVHLESVNGMLMSPSERKAHMFVPDVSENEEDCHKLIDALLGVSIG
ncbi:MAG: hypothetical protein J6P60_05320 [Lachnospiraceae bacterium]|nr:hypothetical protein [Lachnospiraceae bacterium]